MYPEYNLHTKMLQDIFNRKFRREDYIKTPIEFRAAMKK